MSFSFNLDRLKSDKPKEQAEASSFSILSLKERVATYITLLGISASSFGIVDYVLPEDLKVADAFSRDITIGAGTTLAVVGYAFMCASLKRNNRYDPPPRGDIKPMPGVVLQLPIPEQFEQYHQEAA